MPFLRVKVEHSQAILQGIGQSIAVVDAEPFLQSLQLSINLKIVGPKVCMRLETTRRGVSNVIQSFGVALDYRLVLHSLLVTAVSRVCI